MAKVSDGKRSNGWRIYPVEVWKPGEIKDGLARYMRVIPSCRQKGNFSFMIATHVGAVREPPLQLE
jgi:hypothetical protein